MSNDDNSRSSGILYGHQNTVVGRSSLSVVANLEVVCSLGETITVGDIVDGVHEVESVGTCSIDIDCNAWGRSRVVGIVKDQASSRLGGDSGLSANVGDDVVTAV